MAKKFSGPDIVYILQGMVIINNYDSEIWNELLDRLIISEHKTLNSDYKSLLFNLTVYLEIDRPSEYQEWTEKILQNKDQYYKRKREINKFNTHENEIGDILKHAGLIYVQNEIFYDLYEVDIVLPSKSIAIEFTGKPYHISQQNGQMDAFTKLKIRHLQALGWHVITISRVHGTDRKLLPAIKSLEFHDEPKYIHID